MRIATDNGYNVVVLLDEMTSLMRNSKRISDGKGLVCFYQHTGAQRSAVQRGPKAMPKFRYEIKESGSACE